MKLLNFFRTFVKGFCAMTFMDIFVVSVLCGICSAIVIPFTFSLGWYIVADLCITAFGYGSVAYAIGRDVL